jgi:deoxyribodipyrimidine photo-lyase
VSHHKYWTLALGRDRIIRDFSHYEDLRNLPAVDGSSRLSPYIRFGIFSVREIYAKVASNPTLLSEIIWREFWYHIAYYFPEIYSMEFQERRRSIEWKTDMSDYLWYKFEQ